jgi:diguanylate cyclase (GGDEF)-like protein
MGDKCMTELNELSGRFGLTQRETDVLRHMLKGMKNAVIARRLEIAEQTVKDHLSKIYRKIGVENRFQLMHSLVKTSNEKLSALSRNRIPLRRFEEKNRGLEFTDEITGLYNERDFSTLVEHYVKIARRQKKPVLMIFAGVDNLKGIHDTLGDDECDRALKETAHILMDTFRESDIIARYNGSGFAVIPLGTTQAGARKLVVRLQKKLKIHNREKDRAFPLSVSCGVCCCDPKSYRPLDELLFHADRMHEQKKNRKKQSLP